ncbi:MAG TPA: tetratricopeptide repeat protein [Syntrophobacteria bacterium]|nr:tetratricopeptide repeat protein [Syntrophobacteria bacterium]
MIRKLSYLVAVLALITGCSLPRITVLEDALSPEEHLKLGTAYESKKEYDLAAAEYTTASRSLPVAYLFLGNILFLQGKYVEAEQRYRRAIKELPGDPRPYNNLAWLYYTQGIKLEEAENLARRAVALAPAGGDAPYHDTLDQILKARSQGGRFAPTQSQ